MEVPMEDKNIVVGMQLSQHRDRQSRARWTAFLTEVLADLMVAQVREGNRKNNAFNRKAWITICDRFYRKTGQKWDKEQLKNRYSVLRRQYAFMRKLLDQGEFTWNESTGQFTASEESWAKVKGHPDAENIKVHGCPIYKQLSLIFCESTTNGKHYLSAELEGGLSCSISYREPLSVIPEENSSEYEETDDMEDDQEFLPTPPPPPVSTSMRKRGRKGIDGSIAEAIQEMAAASRLRMTAFNHCNGRYSIANCIKELDEMQLLQEEVYLAALDLFNSPNARETFLSLKDDKRLLWIFKKCANPSDILNF